MALDVPGLCCHPDRLKVFSYSALSVNNTPPGLATFLYSFEQNLGVSSFEQALVTLRKDLHNSASKHTVQQSLEIRRKSFVPGLAYERSEGAYSDLAE